MKPLKVSEKSTHRLLVEGKDDLHTVIHLLRRHDLDYDNPPPGLPYIHATDGYSPLLDALSVAAKSYKRLGVVIDADLDPKSRWNEVRHRLKTVGIELPEASSAGGSVSAGFASGWRVGVWLMPDNSQAGTLETFLIRLVPPGDACWPHAGASAKEAKRLGAPYPDKHFPKAHIHTWLSWQEEPGQPFGTAITSASFRTDTADAIAFVGWFKRLFLE
jgi:hypothetical protein